MIYRFFSFLVTVARLSKVGISISVAFSTFIGYLISNQQLDRGIISPTLGVFFLALAASAINQIQEHGTDSLMPRTSSRPLVSGDISILTASFVAFFFAISGFSILLVYNGLLPALLGLFNLLWYNLVYTPLKFKTAFAAVPGGLVGAIPPVIGWLSGGGYIFHYSAISLAIFFFIGQIPHFWLIITRYSIEYNMAGIKSITDKFNQSQLRRLIYAWVAATSICGNLLIFFIDIYYTLNLILIVLFSTLLLIYFTLWYVAKINGTIKTPFILLNAYYLAVMMVILFDHVVY